MEEKVELSYEPAFLLLGSYLKNMKTLIQKDICIPVALFTMAIIQKQPKCPSMMNR